MIPTDLTPFDLPAGCDHKWIGQRLPQEFVFVCVKCHVEERRAIVTYRDALDYVSRPEVRAQMQANVKSL